MICRKLDVIWAWFVKLRRTDARFAVFSDSADAYSIAMGNAANALSTLRRPFSRLRNLFVGDDAWLGLTASSCCATRSLSKRSHHRAQGCDYVHQSYSSTEVTDTAREIGADYHQTRKLDRFARRCASRRDGRTRTVVGANSVNRLPDYCVCADYPPLSKGAGGA